MKKNIRVGLVDDHRLMLDGLRLLIDNMDGYECCWYAEDAASAFEQVQSQPPDLLLVDITMGSRSGLDLIKDIQAVNKGLPILVLSMHDEAVYAQRAIKCGARGYVMKGSSNAELERAIRKVMDGGISVSQAMAERMIEAYTSGTELSSDQGLGKLTDREFEIFQLVGNCRSNTQIAEELGISPKTVDVHKSKIRAKLELEAGASLASHAIRWVEVQRLNSGHA